MLKERFVQVAIVAFILIIAGFVLRGMARSFLGGEVGDLLAAPFIGGGFLIIVVLTIVSVLAYLGIGPLADIPGDNS